MLLFQGRRRFLFVVMATFVASIYGSLRRPLSVDVAWWVWAGIGLDEVPADAPVYLYQGLFSHNRQGERFEPRGYFPHPLDRSGIALVFRFDELIPAEFASKVINRRIERWRRHAVVIREIQLDFDSPTARLSSYAVFLARMRKGFPRYMKFTITGLGTWLLEGEPEDIAAIYQSVDAIVFQLYRGRKQVEKIDRYLTPLTEFEYPFKVGLLPTMSAVGERLRQMNPKRLQGITYFYQRR